MRRREFITLLGGAAAAWPLAANAQQKKKLPLVGVLNPGSTDVPGAVGFYDGLRELGYTEGLNIAIERRYGDSTTDRFQPMAADLVRLKVDVIVVTVRHQLAQPNKQPAQSLSSWPAWPILLVMNWSSASPDQAEILQGLLFLARN